MPRLPVLPTMYWLSYFWSYSLGIHLDSLVSVSDHLPPGHPSTCSNVQIIPLLVSLWNQQSGPDHHFSGQPLDSTVGTRSSLLWSTLIPTVGTRSSLFWSAYGPNGLDQIKFFLVSLWSNYSGPAVPVVGTRSSLFWSSGTVSWDQSLILVNPWQPQSGYNHLSSCEDWNLPLMLINDLKI